MHRPARRPGPSLIAALALCGACQAPEQRWAFGVTRSVLGAVAGTDQVADREAPPERDPDDDWVGAYPFEEPKAPSHVLYESRPVEATDDASGLATLLGLLVAVPLAIDVVLLPVALVHDAVGG